MGGPCPSAGELERLARGEPVPEAARSHAARCEVCRGALEEIRENERFLGGVRTRLIDAAGSVPAARARLASDAVRGFELVEEISRGGQGVVYRAVQTATKRAAAIKVLLGGAFASDRQRHRFEREVEIAAGLRHPNIVSVFESGQTTDGTPYVAMEYVEGVPLDEFVEERFGSRRSADRERVHAVVSLMVRVASGVGHAHTSGVIHRDLKPSNILVDREGNPRVLDFGLARAAEPSRDVSTTREFVGTPAYASPEQIAGDPSSVNARADVYALGMILYRLLTGRHPYPVDGTLAELARHAVGTEPTPPSRIVKRLPSDVETIALKCLAKEPERRYANAAALASDLEDYLEGRAISARRDSAAYVLRKLAMRHRVPAIASGLVLVTIVAATVGLAILASDLDAARRAAEASLAESDVQRARLMAAAGSPEQAERLLWLRTLEGSSGVAGERTLARDPLFAGGAEALRNAWALAEVYASAPCVLRLEPGHEFYANGLGEDEETFWAIDGTGARWTWSMTGELLERTEGILDPVRGYDAIYCEDGETMVVARAETLEVVRVGERAPSASVRTNASDFSYVLSPDGSLVGATNRVGTHEVIVRRGSDLGELVRLRGDGSSNGWLLDDRGLFLLLGTSEGGDTRIEVWSTADWRLVRTLRPLVGEPLAHLGPYRNVQIGPDGSTLLCTMFENLLVGDVRGAKDTTWGRVEAAAPHHTVKFAPSGRVIFTSGNDGVLSVVDTGTLRVERSVVTGAEIQRVAFSEKNMAAIIASIGGGMLMYRLNDRDWLKRFDAVDTTKGCVDISINGDIAWGDDTGRVVLLPGGSRENARSFMTCGEGLESRAAVNSIEFSPDGSRLLTASMDGDVSEWDLEGRQIRALIEDQPKAWSATYAPDGDAIAAGFFGGTLRIWHERARERVADPVVVSLEGCNRVPSVAFSPDGARIALATVGAEVRVVDAMTGAELAVLRGHPTTVRAVAWTPDGKTIMTGADDRRIRLWDAERYEVRATVSGLPWGPFQIRPHPSGAVAFVVGRGGEVFVIDPERGAELARLPVFAGLAFDLAISPDGARVLVTGHDPFVGVIDVERLGAPIRANLSWWSAVTASPELDRPAIYPLITERSPGQ